MHDRPWQDLEALLNGAHEQRVQQARSDENLAMMIDRFDFFLKSEYSSWITDPNDEELEAERKLRKLQGIKPPPIPLLRPVALRHPETTELLLTKYHEMVEQYKKPVKASKPKGTLTIEEYNRLKGIPVQNTD